MSSTAIARTLLICLLAFALAAPLAAVTGAWSSLGPDGGPVFTLASLPNNPQVIYAGVFGGAYKSADRGHDLELGRPRARRPVSRFGSRHRSLPPFHTLRRPVRRAVQERERRRDVFRGQTVQWLTVAPSGSIYAALRYDNVYVSEDGGQTWSPLGVSPDPHSFTTLTADPDDDCRVYAGTHDRGLLAFTRTGTATCP